MSTSVKPFAEHGHYTTVHDAVFDLVMPACPPNAWKVLCFVLRKTRGWGKDEDALSYKQIREGTGISSDATVRKGLAWLVEKKMLAAVVGKDEAGRQMSTKYALNKAYELEASPDTPTDLRSTENDMPITETKDGFATETVDGPTTETVETITIEQEPENNQVVEAPRSENDVPDDTTTTCLRILLSVPDFPRDQGENALKLAQYREEFPNADPVEVCRDFKAYCEETGKKANRLRLRNFFRQAEKFNGHRSSANGHGDSILRSREDKEAAAKRRQEGYEWLFQ